MKSQDFGPGVRRDRVERMAEMTTGRAVRHRVTGDVYMVAENYGTRATAVRVVDITNPDEWELVSNES